MMALMCPMMREYISWEETPNDSISGAIPNTRVCSVTGWVPSSSNDAASCILSMITRWVLVHMPMNST